MKKRFRVTKLESIWECLSCHNERVDKEWDFLPPNDEWVYLPPIGKHKDRVCTRCGTIKDRKDHVVVAYLMEAEEEN